MSQAATRTGNATEQQDLSMLIGAGADPATLEAYLDGLDPEARIQEVRSLSRTALGMLYDRCENAPAANLDEFVPPSAVGKTVIFAGLNNLPMFRLFEKRFTRTKSGTVIGFNFQTMAIFTGPGYFTTTVSGKEILIDYTVLPASEDAPADWPAVKPNNRGLSHFVYKNMQDYCRRVSRDVFIGHATRNGKSMPNYFVLARRPTE